jgi:hypothetical protein
MRLEPEKGNTLTEKREFVPDKEYKKCNAKKRTWAFVGELDGKPQLTCVSESKDK